jgi:signal transduction histidine kinase
LLVALVLVQSLVLRHLLAPVDALREDLKRIERGEIKAVAENVPAEIAPMVQEFNRLLARFEQRLRQSRNAAGNLAHALKGPLNLLMRGGEGSQHAERIAQLIDSELKRARLAGSGSATQRLNLSEELPALCGLLQQVYADKTVDIRYNVPEDFEWPHDRQDMLEMIGNLLDNAVKWADGVVILTVRRVDGIRLEVEDDGPGVSAEKLRQLTQRGARFDESVAGHGLGLSIVKDIVDSYQGSLTFAHSQRLGGLNVTVLLNSNAS